MGPAGVTGPLAAPCQGCAPHLKGTPGEAPGAAAAVRPRRRRGSLGCARDREAGGQAVVALGEFVVAELQRCQAGAELRNLRLAVLQGPPPAPVLEPHSHLWAGAVEVAGAGAGAVHSKRVPRTGCMDHPAANLWADLGCIVRGPRQCRSTVGEQGARSKEQGAGGRGAGLWAGL